MTPSLERWPTKAKETPSPHDIRLTHWTLTQYFNVWRKATSWPFPKCKILKKILRAYPESWGQVILGPKITQLPWKRVFPKKKNIYKIFMYLLDFFIVQNFQKILSTNQEVWQRVSFLDPNCAFVQEKNFFIKNIYIISIYLLAPFIEQNLKKHR